MVLIRPGSLTHHTDVNQRCVELTIVDAGAGNVLFRAPDGPPDGRTGVTAHLGYRMMFLVTNTGIPSVAQFVNFQ